MQTLTLERRTMVVLLDDKFFAYGLENKEKQIPGGTYRVVLTFSARASRGGLWTPWPEYMLPLLENVEGRTGIRIHAANEQSQLEGCIALGQDRHLGKLLSSRLALENLKARVKFPCWMEVLDGPPEA